jgi:hypothetical protein
MATSNMIQAHGRTLDYRVPKIRGFTQHAQSCAPSVLLASTLKMI